MTGATGGPAAVEGGAREELRDAITLRAALIMLGVLLLQLGFALSYMGAFHAPRPHDVPITLVAPPRCVETWRRGWTPCPATPCG